MVGELVGHRAEQGTREASVPAGAQHDEVGTAARPQEGRRGRAVHGAAGNGAGQAVLGEQLVDQVARLGLGRGRRDGVPGGRAGARDRTPPRRGRGRGRRGGAGPRPPPTQTPAARWARDRRRRRRGCGLRPRQGRADRSGRWPAGRSGGGGSRCSPSSASRAGGRGSGRLRPGARRPGPQRAARGRGRHARSAARRRPGARPPTRRPPRAARPPVPGRTRSRGCGRRRHARGPGSPTRTEPRAGRGAGRPRAAPNGGRPGSSETHRRLRRSQPYRQHPSEPPPGGRGRRRRSSGRSALPRDYGTTSWSTTSSWPAAARSSSKPDSRHRSRSSQSPTATGSAWTPMSKLPS